MPFEPNVSKQSFYDDMNRHGNSTYYKTGPYIVEAEGDRWRDTGLMRVWEAVGDNPTNEQNSYRWTLRGRESFESADEMDSVAAQIYGSKKRIRAWAKEHRPDDYDRHWAEVARKGEWSRARRDRGR